MLYSLQDARDQALMPLRWMAEATRMTFVNPLHPMSWTPLGRGLAAGAGVIESLIAVRGKPEWGLDYVETPEGMQGIHTGTELEKPFCTLRHFRTDGPSDAGAPYPPRILLVAPMSGHFATLLRDTVRALLGENEVWVTDWANAADVPTEAGNFSVETYIEYLIAFLAHLHQKDPSRPVHIMAVCQPAPLVLAATALLAEDRASHRPASMILMGGPVDTRKAPTAVTRIAENRSLEWFRRNMIHRVPHRYDGANRRVYPGFLQLRAFWSMNPARHAGAHWGLFKHLVQGDGDSAERTRSFYDEYMAVSDVPADFFLETVDHVFKKHSIPGGTFFWKNRHVDPGKINDIGLMTVEGELDDISAPTQTEAAHTVCTNIPKPIRAHLLQAKVGHYGIFNGRRWREMICPEISKFVRKIEGAARKAW